MAETVTLLLPPSTSYLTPTPTPGQPTWLTWGALVPSMSVEVVWEAVGDTWAVAHMLGRIAMYTVTLAAEGWPFDVTVLIAGWLGPHAVAAHAIMVTVAGWAFGGVPAALAAAARAEVRAHLDAGARGRAHHVAVVTALACVLYMFSVALLLLLGHGAVGGLFSPSPAVQANVAAVALVTALFCTLDGFQGSLGSVIRGVSPRMWWGVWAAGALAWWGLALPLAVSGVGGGRIHVTPDGADGGNERLVSVWLAMVGAVAVNALTVGAAFHCLVFPYAAPPEQ